MTRVEKISKFVEHVSNIHNCKYDYSETIYNKLRDKIKIICPIHGVFYQRADHHYRGSGCKQCITKKSGTRHKITKEYFLEKANVVHNNTYCYDKVTTVSSSKYITISCKKHGDFSQQVKSHLSGAGCKKCSNEKDMLRRTGNTTHFIEQSNKIHNNRFDYSKTKYVKSYLKIIVTCKDHGDFIITPHSHLQGKKCRKCSNIEGKNKRTYTQHEFIEKSILIHGNIYDYSKVEYKGVEHKINIICKKHGVFEQEATGHLQGYGCPKCNLSKGELKIIHFFENNNIEYESQYRYNDCRDKLPLPFDFKINIKDIDLLIEFNGQQHYRPYFKFGGEVAMINTQKRDSIKSEYCKHHNIPLLVIKYDDIDNIETILTEFISKFNK